MTRTDEITSRLRELSELLRDPELDDVEAEQLANEASELIAEAGTEIDRRLGEAAGGASE